ncbi:MAG TPA: VOC family protein [Kofleriaceae bacterium]|nr:VOC family protein [Kofleriaceae bacterium]
MKSSINWFEIPVRDLAASSAFYASVIGRPLKHEVFGGVPHAMFATEGEDAVTGALVQNPRRKAGAGVVIYLDVSGVADAVERATRAGARIIEPLTDIGPFGTIALIEDRDGNVVGLHTPK